MSKTDDDTSASAAMWKLSPFDDFMPDIDLCFILCFPCPDSQQKRAACILSRSYAQLVSDNPVLGATIQPAARSAATRPGTKVVVQAPADTNIPPPTLRIRDGRSELEQSYAELQAHDFPRRNLTTDVLMPSRDTSVPQTRCTAAAQATFIQDGCLLAFNTSHAFMDASGAARVLSAWAEYASAAAAAAAAAETPFPSISLLPSPSDTATLNPHVSTTEYHTTLKHDARAWHMLGLDYRPREASSAVLAARIVPRGPPVTRQFCIQADALARLKADCLDSTSSPLSSSWISTNDALNALIWRSVITARTATAATKDDFFEEKQTTTLMVPMSVRNILSPPITPNYLGNVVLYAIPSSTTTTLPTTPLGTTAQTIRAALSTHQDPAVLRTALRLAAGIPDVSALGLVYPTWLENDVVISSLYGLPLYRASWGGVFGGHEGDGQEQRPDAVRFPYGMFDGVCFVMPKREDGGVEVSVTMYEPDMERFLGEKEEEGFLRYAAVMD
ncbi:transferase family-domain-containing protein [Bombardia bombarda]|uniref:Transferase family-domain-containing protein n=1 Tax=Bombardia bombarda TaxID=252184 RepID=A0AA39WN57_9PEZI|nr:transferase family-domain-containing protein [Bombardia bombarda]